jgi:hypothetical protein
MYAQYRQWAGTIYLFSLMLICPAQRLMVLWSLLHRRQSGTIWHSNWLAVYVLINQLCSSCVIDVSLSICAISDPLVAANLESSCIYRSTALRAQVGLGFVCCPLHMESFHVSIRNDFVWDPSRAARLDYYCCFSSFCTHPWEAMCFIRNSKLSLKRINKANDGSKSISKLQVIQC